VISLALAASLFGTSLEVPPLPPIRREPQVVFVDRNGAVLGARGGRYSPPVDVARLPPYVPAAFVAIEDRRFYEHAGIDPVGIARAIVADIGSGRASEGASTITQQLARNLYLGSERTMERKAREMVLAVQLEQAYSKKQILGLYLSRVYFGEGAYGIEAAARRYFDKPAARLTLKEAAMLAALMKSPTNYDPVTQPQASTERANLVLQAMAETGAITAAQRARAAAASPRVWRAAPSAGAQYFIDWVDAQARTLSAGAKGDLVVETTLDLPMEEAAEAQAQATTARFKAAGVSEAALVSVDGSGAVRALIGGVDYASSPYDRAVSARRQAGSAWKPFVYLAAMEAGRTPDDVVVDEPVTIAGWSPHDFEEGYLGSITLETALARSINTVAARLADEVGRDKVAAAARRLGIGSTINTDPAMALGTSQVSPLEMAGAYDAFSNGGLGVTPYGIERIRTEAGQTVWRRRAPAPVQSIVNPPLSELDRMLRAVIARGTGVRAAIPGYDLAGKTGTTSDFRDAWFCGFTGGLATVVWMGRDDDAPMRGITGGSAPAEMWRGFMKAALRRADVRPIPPGPPAPTSTPVPVQAADEPAPPN
jgi:penicillin-binding protein 1A